MKLRKDLLAGIRRFIALVPSKSASRGRHYYESGAVLELQCVESDKIYTARVRGGEDYEVSLEFADGDWAGECTCPMFMECKHIVAALLALERSEPTDDPPVTAPTVRNLTLGAAAGSKPRAVAQPARSPLVDKLLAQLGRPLQKSEVAFVRGVQNAFEQSRIRALNLADLGQLLNRREFHSFNYWERLELWPEPPRDDYQFWLYLAWAFRGRNWVPPAFMTGITDLGLIEPVIREWERQKEIERWQEWFRKFEEVTPASEPAVLELRLAVFPGEARLQWRVNSKAEFAELKQAHAKKLSEQFQHGALVLAPDSLPIWSATYKPWHYESWWSFKYTDSTAHPALGRLLRLGLDSGQLVMADGRPLPRHESPLRLRLRPPENGGADYELALLAADGSPAPEIFCALRGKPTLYLTEQGLFTGPPAELLDKESRKTIPVAALETSDGLRFLHSAEVPLPEHLAKRIRTVPITVTVSCGLKPTYPGSQTEELNLTVDAEAEGMISEHFSSQGWRKDNGMVPEPDEDMVVLHDRTAQKHFPRVLEALPGLKWQDYSRAWTMRVGKKTPEAFVAWLESLPAEVAVELNRELASLRDAPISGTVSLDLAEAGIDWFDLKVALKVTDSTLSAEELRLLLNARGGYVRLGKKGWRRLRFNLTAEDDEQLARLGLDARDFSAEPQRFHALQLADEAAKRFLAPERIEKIQRRVGELKTRVTPPIPAAIQANLRPYQTEGFHFLAYLTVNRFGGVLADDMGLGKTLQALAWLAWLRETAATSSASIPSLVVCPKSVMDNWRTEAGHFCPGLRVQLLRGDHGELEVARETSDLVVVNYSQLRALMPRIAGISWLAAILDEAQYIKNPDSQTAQAARALKANHRLALTGTPIENRLLDLWSIFGFAMPGALGNRAHFLRRFNAKDDPLARRRLSARVRPFLLRRTKSQVAKDLPDRVEEDLHCELEGTQATLYRAELKRARQILLGLKTNRQLNEQRFNILTSLLRLRQICCHPALVDGALRKEASAKLAALEDLLEPLMEEGHKVLVFSQFVTMLDLLREKIEQRQWSHFYLAGDTENRGALVESFQAAKGSAVFLISLKAGGFGLNLTAASYVVLFDPWWNPAVENQAIDRTHRIGQQSKVIAYRLLARDSIEGKIRQLQKRKAALAADVLGEERFAQSLTLEDLQFLFAE